MSNRGESRPFPPAGAVALPGHRDPDSYFYVVHGADCVLLCEYGDVARWKNGAVLTPDEARRLGRELMAQADAAEGAAEHEQKTWESRDHDPPPHVHRHQWQVEDYVCECGDVLAMGLWR